MDAPAELTHGGVLLFIGSMLAATAIAALGVWGWRGRTPRARKWVIKEEFGVGYAWGPSTKLGFFFGFGLLLFAVSGGILSQRLPEALTWILIPLAALMFLAGGVLMLGGLVGVVPRWIGPRWYREYAKKRRAETKRAREKRRTEKRGAKEERQRGVPEPAGSSLAPLDAESARGIASLRSLVEEALSRSRASRGDTAVLHSVADPGRYVQWLSDAAGITLEVSSPQEAGAAAEKQIAALRALEFSPSDQGVGNLVREMSRRELERGDVAEVVARVLWQVLGIRDPSGVEVEVH